MVKISFILFTLLLSGFSFSQADNSQDSPANGQVQPHVTLSLPEHRILYANYDNVIDINGLNGMNELEYVLENLTVQPDPENPQRLLARTTTGANEAKIRFQNKSDHSFVNEVVFMVRSLPLPLIIYTVGASKLVVGYGPEMPLASYKISFQISEWEVVMKKGKKEMTVKGMGYTLSAEAQSVIKKAPKESQFRIKVKFSGGGYENRTLTKVFTKSSSMDSKEDPLAE
jgi:hypothetical protein